MATSAHIICLKSDGTPWSWGNNTWPSVGAYGGQLGDGTVSSQSSPVLVVGSHTFAQISCGASHTLGLKSDGTLWAWGNSYSGQLGNGSFDGSFSTAFKTSPVVVLGSHSFTKASAGGNYEYGSLDGSSYALKTDGTVWAWGVNAHGQLGLNNTNSQSSPVLVVGSHSFQKISCGGINAAALKSDGSVWCWGYNNYGQIGDETTSNNSSPVAVIGGHSFIQVAVGYQSIQGLKSDGTVWSWGYNGTGQLGDNTKTNTSSPVLVVGNHSFKLIVAGYECVYGLKTDGSAWSWGRNNGGSLGDNTTIGKSSPVVVVGSHSFTMLFAGGFTSAHVGYTGYGAGLKSDGSVWMWGADYFGQLGDNTGVTRSSPVLVVGSHAFSLLPDWQEIDFTIIVAVSDSGTSTEVLSIVAPDINVSDNDDVVVEEVEHILNHSAWFNDVSFNLWSFDEEE